MKFKTVFITGATGMLGVDVAKRLQDLGYGIIALVHKQPALITTHGEELEFSQFDGEKPAPGKITVLKGDVTADKLGLEDDIYQQLLKCVDVVIHSAAVTEFGFEDEVYERVNVGGVRNILQFVGHDRAEKIPLLHISTAYVCGDRRGVIRENELNMSSDFSNSYERTKHKSEKMVVAAGEGGVPLVIARPSIIVGEGESGMTRDFKNIYSVIRLISLGNVHSMPGNYDANLDLVPIDYVARGVVALLENFSQAIGKSYHLVSPNPITLMDLSEVLAEYPYMRVIRFIPPRHFSIDALNRKQRFYYGKVARHYNCYITRNLSFCDQNLRDLLGEDAERAVTGKTLLRRLFNYCEDVGYWG